METMTAAVGGLSRTDLESLREVAHDRRRYELIDGVIVVTPSPSRRHQRVARGVQAQLSNLSEQLIGLFAPLDVDLASDTTVQPDLLVVDRTEFDDEARPVRPLLVVEILSPSTSRIDQLLKRERYERASVPSYWIIDPAGPSVTVCELRDGQYVEAATATGNETIDVQLPARLTLRPAGWLD